MKNISVEDLRDYAKDGKDYFLIDVREQEELDVLKMDGMPYHHFPMSDFTSYLEKVPTDKEVVVFCKLGGRSAKVAEFLEENGYENVSNLIGGIMRWAESK